MLVDAVTDGSVQDVLDLVGVVLGKIETARPGVLLDEAPPRVEVGDGAAWDVDRHVRTLHARNHTPGISGAVSTPIVRPCSWPSVCVFGMNR